jgi:hypothetical protein
LFDPCPYFLCSAQYDNGVTDLVGLFMPPSLDLGRVRASLLELDEVVPAAWQQDKSIGNSSVRRHQFQRHAAEFLYLDLEHAFNG